MPSSSSRRAFLRTATPALLVAAAGCNGSSGDTDTPTPETSSAGRTYSVEIVNALAKSDLEAMREVDPDEPATVSVTVKSVTEDLTTTEVFVETVELDSGGSTTFDAAFGTETDGTEYVVSAEAEPFVEHEGSGGRDFEGTYRFTPGKINTPADDSFRVRVYDDDPDWPLALTLDIET